MQVKKFEARTMKEALEMVKTHLGPDAIILSARDNKKSFGLVGEVSVEITAAVSDVTLQKKKFAENKLSENTKANFQKSTARVQKELIEKIVQKEYEKQKPRPVTTQRYIEIDEPRTAAEMPAPQRPAPENNLIRNLQSEISALKQVIGQFQKIPQQMSGGHPGSDYGLPYDVSFLFEKLTHEGVSETLASQILHDALKKIPTTKYKNKAFFEGWVAKNILETTQLSSLNLDTKVHVFLGPSGAGKTSTLVKMASHLIIREKKKVGFVTTDTVKVGASDQMKIYAQILNVPFTVVRQPTDWMKLQDYLQQVDVILVDYPALDGRQLEQIQAWKNLLPPSRFLAQKHLVLSCTSRFADMKEAAQRLSPLNPDDLIITNLDESTQRGTVFSAMKELGLPLFAFGIGSRVPEDFEFATRERVLDLIFRITEKRLADTVER